MADTMEEVRQQKVLCRFVTKMKDERYKLDESIIGDVAIPAEATRYALSKTVKALLGQSGVELEASEEEEAEGGKQNNEKRTSGPIFDFLVEGELLRSEIARHLERRGLSVEKTLVVEYFLAIEPPEPNVDLPQPDWVCSVTSASWVQDEGSANAKAKGKANQPSTDDLLFSGCYDGTLNVHSGKTEGGEGEQYYSSVVHGEAVSALCIFNISEDDDNDDAGQSQQVLVTASKDNSMKGWFLTCEDEDESAKHAEKKGGRKKKKTNSREAAPSKSVSLSQVFEFVGHTGSVESLAASPGSCRFCSGGWDNKIKVWITDGEDLAGAKKNAKKQKLSSSNKEDADEDKEAKGLEQVETTSFDGHKHCVSALSWPEENLICSTSWDSTVKCWDVSKGQVVSNLIQESALFCLDASKNALHSGNLNLAFGGTDGNVSVWDPREHRKDNKLASVKLMKSHKAIVSDVSWSSSSPFHLASCDYEGVVKVWDLRSSMPLHSLQIHEDKALCLNWFGSTLASGGADKKVSLQVVNTMAT